MNRLLIITGLLLFLIASSLYAEDYKKYTVTTADDSLLQISFSNGQTVISLYGKNGIETIQFNDTDVTQKGDSILIFNRPFIVNGQFITPKGPQPLDIVSKIELEFDGNQSRIALLKRSDEAPTLMASRKKNKIAAGSPIILKRDQFLRGSVMSFWSDIEVNGEVNGHVIALYGNIKIGDDAIIRGNVLAVNGSVEYGKNSTVYGSVHTSNIKDDKHETKSWRLRLGRDGFSTIGKFHYNRIDGATPYFGAKYFRPDSTLPGITAYVGYGFASERWRFHVGLKQFMLNDKSLQLGATYYKKLASHDDWLISETENTIFALLATEDFKDYYEAEGGYFYSRYKTKFDIDLELGYQIESPKWLDAHKNLWSLFGGSKRFPENYSGITFEPYRSDAIALMNNNDFKSLIAKINYNADAREDYPIASFFMGRASLEWTPSSWNDSLDYTRLLTELYRFQKINWTSGLIFHLAYGKLSGDMTLIPYEYPIQKLFSLGGLGTLHGYNHKGYYGSEFWLGTIEYSFNFPTTSWDTWLFYEAGQIGKSGELSKAEVKNSVGIGFSFQNMIRLNIAERLDRSGDSPKLYVRLKHQF